MSDKTRYVLEDLLHLLFVGVIIAGFIMVSLSFMMGCEGVSRHHIDGEWLIATYGYGGLTLLIFAPVAILAGLEKINPNRY